MEKILGMCFSIAMLAALVFPQSAVVSGVRTQSFDMGWKFYKGDATGTPQATSFNDASWQSINVPHDLVISGTFSQNAGASGNLPYSHGWYRKSFTMPSDASGKKVFITFDAVYNHSTVWINGTSLGSNTYGFNSFQYDVTQYLTYGSTANVLAVQLQPAADISWWYTGAGVNRHVWLTMTDNVHVKKWGTYVTTPTVSASASVNVKTTVVNQSTASSSVTLKTEILNQSNAVVATDSAVSSIAASAEYEFNRTLSVSSPALWSPDNPVLYKVRSTVITGGNVVDVDTTRFGIRTINFDLNNGFSINGVGMKLKGVCNHTDLGCLGSASYTSVIRHRVGLLKNMGCNAIRTAHNQPDPQLLEVCDEMGMMIMDEGYCSWTLGSNFVAQYQQEVSDWITRDRNHPCVIMWSVANEDHDLLDPANLSYLTQFCSWIRAKDITHPITSGNNYGQNGSAATMTANYDIVGQNYSPSAEQSYHDSNHWKVFGSEVSSSLRSRGVYLWPTSQNFTSQSDNQCSNYDNSLCSWCTATEDVWKTDLTMPYEAGIFIWTGFDYIGEPTPYGWPSRSSYFGIIDLCGFPKDIYYGLQSQWTNKNVLHILPHWNWSSGSTVPVWTYTNCDNVELFLNGSSQGAKNLTTSNGTMHLEWNVPWQTGTLVAIGKKSGAIVARDTVRTAGAAAKVELLADRSAIAADGVDCALIETNILDAQDIFMPTASNSITWSVSGPGKIIGTDNGNSTDHTSFPSLTRSAFSGKALAVVQSTGGAGAITVTASSSGLTSGSVTINASTHVRPGEASVSPKAPASYFTRVAGMKLSLSHGNGAGSTALHIYDLRGRLVGSFITNKEAVNLRRDCGIADGIYLVKVVMDRP
jgi:beta-galactosidase